MRLASIRQPKVEVDHSIQYRLTCPTTSYCLRPSPYQAQDGPLSPGMSSGGALSRTSHISNHCLGRYRDPELPPPITPLYSVNSPYDPVP